MQDKSVPIPGAFSVPIAVMQYMNWSWSEYASAPEPLVNEIVMRMERSSHWQEERRKRDERERARKAKGR